MPTFSDQEQLKLDSVFVEEVLLCDQISEESNLKQERFLLAPGFRGWPAPLVLGLCQGRNILTEVCGRGKLLTSWRVGSRGKGKEPEVKSTADKMPPPEVSGLLLAPGPYSSSASSYEFISEAMGLIHYEFGCLVITSLLSVPP